MIDMGLTPGAKSLWQDNLLFDYTIKVQDQEFRVHKVVLASVSEYFRAMLGGSMKESTTDSVELQELNAEAVSTIIDLIYTGDENLIDGNATELLGCAVYLQIHPAISACKKKLIEELHDKNCLRALRMTMAVDFFDESEIVQTYIKSNWTSVLANSELEEVSIDLLQDNFGLWKGSEWELFQFVKDWIAVDYDDRIDYLNELMSNVRFPLMTAQEIQTVKATAVYLGSDGPWKDLVDRACGYHLLPVHLKVLDESEQTTVRGSPMPVIFSTTQSPTTMYTLKENYEWKKHDIERQDVPDFTVKMEGTIVVNNFLLACTELAEGQRWYIFNSRTMTWSGMPPMSRPKSEFTAVHHDKHVYILGGCLTGQGPATDEVERYSLENNTWESVTKLPTPVRAHGSCLFDDAIYTSGGVLYYQGCQNLSLEFVRFNISSHTWERLAPLSGVKNYHSMQTMKIRNRDTIVSYDMHADENQMEFYDPEANQWSLCRRFSQHLCIFRFQSHWENIRMVYVWGNTIFCINCMDYNSERVSKILDIPENGTKTLEVTFKGLPLPQGYIDQGEELFGGLLSMPLCKHSS